MVDTEEDFSNSLNCLISLRNKDLRKALHILKKKKAKAMDFTPLAASSPLLPHL